MRCHRYPAWAALLFLLYASASASGSEKIKLGSIVDSVDVTILLPLLKRGEVGLVESHKSGRLRQATIVALINASPARVWQTLTDYQSYTRFMPNLLEAKVVKLEGNRATVYYELEVPGINMEYTLLHQHYPKRRIDISLADDPGDIKTGAWRWELQPLANGAQTILVYTLYTDVAESSWIIRQAMKSQPLLEHGLNVATGQVTVQAIKKRAEGQ